MSMQLKDCNVSQAIIKVMAYGVVVKRNNKVLSVSDVAVLSNAECCELDLFYKKGSIGLKVLGALEWLAPRVGSMTATNAPVNVAVSVGKIAIDMPRKAYVRQDALEDFR